MSSSSVVAGYILPCLEWKVKGRAVMHTAKPPVSIIKGTGKQDMGEKRAGSGRNSRACKNDSIRQWQAKEQQSC